MASYVCPHCGNDGSKGKLSRNMIIEAYWEGEFNEKGEFEVDECQSPDYETSDAHNADEANGYFEDQNRVIQRPRYYCGACNKDFQEPKKEE